DQYTRREIPFKSLSTRTTISPSRTPTSKPGTVCSSSSEEIREPTTPQKVTNSTRKRLTVKTGVMFQGEVGVLLAKAKATAGPWPRNHDKRGPHVFVNSPPKHEDHGPYQNP